jgi:adenosine deaminase
MGNGTEAVDADFIRGLPKAELHLHIEGTLEPDVAFALARRHGVALPWPSVDALRAAYDFTSLDSFLDVYYQTADVLRTEQDFFDLTWAYLQRARNDGVRRAEIFFDPQTHTGRGIPIGTVIDGITDALDRGRDELGVSSGLILCFLRHLPPDAAVQTWNEAEPYADRLLGVGLDSSEVDNPPGLFAEAFARARAAGLRAVAHAGEEGPASYVREALDVLEVERVDHGIRAIEDPALVSRLSTEQCPLTVCPLSNVRLRAVPRLEDHPLPRLLSAGVKVTVNSDDPAFFGGYVVDNYVQTTAALRLTRSDLVTLARNSLEASFVDDSERRQLLAQLDAYVAANR